MIPTIYFCRSWQGSLAKLDPLNHDLGKYTLDPAVNRVGFINFAFVVECLHLGESLEDLAPQLSLVQTTVSESFVVSEAV